ncbi:MULTISPECIES: tetratricopeptide repeat protein [unclassified Acinetobacter]|uniref:tetratricopeptide repeat protein n=1 Tax=unclassified Acinetobacter TaxID=196816 RepID=UPI0035B85789
MALSSGYVWAAPSIYIDDEGRKTDMMTDEKVQQMERDYPDNPYVLYDVGAEYFRGEHVAKDMSKVKKYWQKAAEKGHTFAQYNLAILYQEGEIDGQPNLEKSFYWFLQSKSYYLSQYALGGTKDLALARKYYQLAAVQGNASAQNNLGILYDKGLGVAKDRQQAKYWYSLAAEQGEASAEFNLGNYYYQSDWNIKDNRVQAEYWWKRAAAQGHQGAKELLQKIDFH